MRGIVFLFVVLESSVIASKSSLRESLCDSWQSIKKTIESFDSIKSLESFCRFCIIDKISVFLDCFGDKSPRKDGKSGVVIARKSAGFSWQSIKKTIESFDFMKSLESFVSFISL